MQFKNKTAIITGAGQGIGLGIATALADQGCNVVVADINQEFCNKASSKLNEITSNVLPIVCDVTSSTDVENLISKTLEKFGSIDILVNNAGIYPFCPFEKMTNSDWDRVMNVNLKGVFLCTKQALTAMKSGSRIINISSIASMVGFEGLTHYCASKGGVNSFTRALALELATKGITVNAIAPGAISTPGLSTVEDALESTIKAVPMGRIGDPMDIAGLVIYLASDSADYITGQIIAVDGGWTLR